ncbi:hypothetical protein B566_EDAN014828 [Ephemera danica]|nr:hypothetical protein B566_EDAN014828 [Ephemera danica]
MKMFLALFLLAVICSCTAQDKKIIGLSKLPLTNLTVGFYHIELTDRNWFEADIFCRSNNLALVSFETKTEQDVVFAELQRLGIHANAFWTSGNDLAMEATYFWSQTGRPFGFTSWAPNEPNNAGGAENCVTLTHSMNTPRWNDGACSSRRWSICELPTACWGYPFTA